MRKKKLMDSSTAAAGISSSCSFTICQSNVAMANRDERDHKTGVCTKFDTRYPTLLEMLHSSGADVITLQEALRELKDSSKSGKVLIEDLSDIYEAVYEPYDSEKQPFFLVVLYKKSVFELVEKRVIELHPPLSGGDRRVALGLKLRYLKSSSAGKQVWVFSTHFHMSASSKERSSKTLIAELMSDPDDYQHVLVAGDFNFFPDDGSYVSRDILNLGFPDLAFPLQDGVHGSFCGFPHDSYGPSPEELSQLKLSRLDYVFSRGFKRSAPHATALGDLSAARRQRYPSDHLMISIPVMFV